MSGYYLVGPVTRLEGNAKACPLTTQSCPFALDEGQTLFLEKQLETFRGLISGAYQTKVRRLSKVDLARLQTSIAEGTGQEGLKIADEIKRIYRHLCSQPRSDVIICYARRDNKGSNQNTRWLDRLLEHLQPLRAEDRLSVWSDSQLKPGEEWRSRLESALHSAKAAVLLVSPAFLASDFIRTSELPVLLQKAKEKGVVILPIILRPCLFKETKFRYPDPRVGPEEFSLANLQATNSPEEPLSGLR